MDQEEAACSMLLSKSTQKDSQISDSGVKERADRALSQCYLEQNPGNAGRSDVSPRKLVVGSGFADKRDVMCRFK